MILVCATGFQSIAPIKSSVLLRTYSSSKLLYLPIDRLVIVLGPWKMLCTYPTRNVTLESGRIVRLVSVMRRTVLYIIPESVGC